MERSATLELMREANRDLAVHSYQIGWLNQTIKHAEEKLSRLSDVKNRDVLMAVIADVIRELRDGRENAEAQAKENAI
jgi:hypothetical protein